MPGDALNDAHGREFHYLRLSLDDACDLRCLYCLPNGWRRTSSESPLTQDEIKRLVAAFAELGFWKLRLTGGEPTVRRDLVEIARAVSATPGIRTVALSSNGRRLAGMASELAAAGVSAFNISVDSLDPVRFEAITGAALSEVWSGVERCLELGLKTKINCVLLRGLNDQDWDGFVALTRRLPLSVRFIELMQTGENKEFFSERHRSAAGLVTRLLKDGWLEEARKPGDGPARSFVKNGYAGSIGVIAPYAPEFCSTCNRLRVTARGGLRLCLFSDGELPLREFLQKDESRPGLIAAVRRAIAGKLPTHRLHEGVSGDLKQLSMTGG